MFNFLKHKKPNVTTLPLKAVSLNYPSVVGELASRDRSPDYYGLPGMPLPNPDPVLKKMGKDITAYKSLLSDAYIGGCASSRAAGVQALSWDIDSSADSRAADFCRQALKDLKFHKVISALLSAPLYGYTIAEIIWRLKSDNLVYPVSVDVKPRHWFCYDGDNRLMFRSRENPTGEFLPDRKFLVATNNAEYENPYGDAVMSRCFWPGVFKHGGVKFWVTFAEKFGMPHVIGKLPRSAGEDEERRLLHMLDNMVRDAVAVIPDNSDVEIRDYNATGQSSALYKDLLGYCDKAVAIALLGQTLTTDVGDAGSYAAAKTHMLVRDDIVDSDKKIIEETAQQLINWICELNFPNEPRPEFSMYSPKKIDIERANRDKVLTDSGVRFKKNYYTREYDLSEDDFDLTEPATASGAMGFKSGTGCPPKDEAKAPEIIDITEVLRKPSAINMPVAAADNAAQDIKQINDTSLQSQADDLVKPIINLIRAGASYDEAMSKLDEMFPKLDDAKLTSMLERAIFIADVLGRVEAEQKR